MTSMKFAMYREGAFGVGLLSVLPQFLPESLWQLQRMGSDWP
ncbi:Unknown protein sequence [Pseudomonas amygdali pv. lachrymans]|nr:Unknown protein sequence [Pseudomonas amygdali pv. lachrymans]